MKSPFTGKEMKLVYEKRTLNFRGEKFEYEHASWLCEDTGEQFTTDEMDTASLLQVTNQYRAKYGIPYTDEIFPCAALSRDDKGGGDGPYDKGRRWSR